MSSFSLEILPPESTDDPNSEDFGLVNLILDFDGDVCIDGISSAAATPFSPMPMPASALWTDYSTPGQNSYPYWNPASPQNFPGYTAPVYTNPKNTINSIDSLLTGLAGHSPRPPAPSPVALSGKQSGGLDRQPRPVSPLLQRATSRQKTTSIRAKGDTKGAPQRRLPTPHPRSQHEVRHGTSERLAQRAASRTVKPSSKESEKPSDTTKPSKIISRPNSLCAPKGDGRLARTTPPYSNRRRQPEIVGRPLWSGNFAGANAPEKPPHAVRTAVVTRRSGAPNQLPSAPVSSGKDTGALPAASTLAPSAPSDGAATETSRPPPPQCTRGQQSSSTPTVQYVNYNYRPVLVQSPKCIATGLLCSDGDSTLNQRNVSLGARQRSTSSSEFLMHRE